MLFNGLNGFVCLAFLKFVGIKIYVSLLVGLFLQDANRQVKKNNFRHQ